MLIAGIAGRVRLTACMLSSRALSAGLSHVPGFSGLRIQRHGFAAVCLEVRHGVSASEAALVPPPRQDKPMISLANFDESNPRCIINSPRSLQAAVGLLISARGSMAMLAG